MRILKIIFIPGFGKVKFHKHLPGKRNVQAKKMVQANLYHFKDLSCGIFGDEDFTFPLKVQ